MNEGNAQSTGGFGRLRANRARAALAVAQVALALVLLVGAGLLLRSFVRLITVDRGYDPANVITARIRNPDATFRPDMTPESMVELRAVARRFQESLVEETARLEVLPDVEAIGVSSRLPLASAGGSTTLFRVVGAPPPTEPGDLQQARVNIVSPGYFDAMRLRIRSGRAFTRLDGPESPAVQVVNETLARELFGGEPAVGQRLLLAGASPEPWEVVGVVGDVRYGGLTITESQAEAYMPLHQMERAAMFAGMLSAPVVAVRTAGDPVAAVPFLREAVAAVSPSAAVDDVMTMDARLSAAVTQPRFYAVFVGFFAVLALLLAAFGIYALLSYAVSQRRREIGVRMALGAQRGDVVALVVRQGAGLVAAGTVVGLLASAGSVRLLESFLFGVTGDDRLTLVGAPLVLAGVALIACWLPGHRAARIDPMDALRVEQVAVREGGADRQRHEVHRPSGSRTRSRAPRTRCSCCATSRKSGPTWRWSRRARCSVHARADHDLAVRLRDGDIDLRRRRRPRGRFRLLNLPYFLVHRLDACLDWAEREGAGAG